MKLIIDITQDCYDYWCGKKGEYAIADALTSGMPYNPSGDLISREALKTAIEQGEGFSWDSYGKDDLCVRKKYIDNAPTVEDTSKLKEVKDIIWNTSLPDACKIMKLRKLIDYQ